MLNAGIITKDEFEKLIEKDRISVVDFSATWCGPCRMMEPVMEDLSDRMKGVCYFYNIDIDASPDIADMFKIEAVPTVIVFKKGVELGRTSGYQELDEIQSFINSVKKD